MYNSPIEMSYSFSDSFAQRFSEDMDKLVLTACFDVGVKLDKAELIKALEYDRDQYEKGYRDGKKDAVNYAYWNKRGDEWAFPYDCSNCGHGVQRRTPYCPFCGAIMDKEEGGGK